MSADQQNQCVGLLLAIAMDGRSSTNKESLQGAVKKFLCTLPPEDIALAAATPMEFLSNSQAEEEPGLPGSDKI